MEDKVQMEIMLLILIGVNWVIYHKIFRVYYFGNVGQSIFKEIFGCSLVAVLELAIIMTVGGAVLGALPVVGAIGLGSYAVYRGYKFVKGRNGEISEGGSEEETVGNGEDIRKDESGEVYKPVQKEQQDVAGVSNEWFCVNCGKPIPKNVKFCMFCGAGNVSADDKKGSA